MIAGIVIAALACAALAFVVAPLRTREEHREDASPERAELVDRKRAALTAIIDMEEERDAGKLSADDFAVLRDEYEHEAAAALVELDALRASGVSAEDAIEAEIAAIRARLQQTAPRGRAVEPCPSCGTPRAPGRACERCGA